jgi:hypothetical protein
MTPKKQYLRCPYCGLNYLAIDRGDKWVIRKHNLGVLRHERGTPCKGSGLEVLKDKNEALP